MGGQLIKVGTGPWWAAMILLFLAVELVFHMKLGSVWVMAGFFVLAYQWVAVWLGDSEADSDPLGMFLLAIYVSITACAGEIVSSDSSCPTPQTRLTPLWRCVRYPIDFSSAA